MEKAAFLRRRIAEPDGLRMFYRVVGGREFIGRQRADCSRKANRRGRHQQAPAAATCAGACQRRDRARVLNSRSTVRHGTLHGDVTPAHLLRAARAPATWTNCLYQQRRTNTSTLSEGGRRRQRPPARTVTPNAASGWREYGTTTGGDPVNLAARWAASSSAPRRRDASQPRAGFPHGRREGWDPRRKRQESKRRCGDNETNAPNRAATRSRLSHKLGSIRRA